MKKCLSILCVVAMLFAFMVPVSAATEMTLTVGSATAKPGDTVYLPVIIDGIETSETEAICLLDYVVTFDTTYLTFNAVTKYSATKEPWKTWKKEPGFARGLVTLAFTTPLMGAYNDLPFIHVAADADGENGYLAAISVTVNADAPAGDYPINLRLRKCQFQDQEMAESGVDPLNLPLVTVSGKITVEADAPAVVAKTVTYTANHGKVIASTTETFAGEPVASGTITTAGAAKDEDVFFYFFPDAGYTAAGMMIDGVALIGASKKVTVDADKAYTFDFVPVDASATAAISTVASAPATEIEAKKIATFGTATNASEFGIIIAKGDTLGEDADLDAAFAAASESGAIRKYVANEANGEGQFAIEVIGPLFKAGASYIARLFAANNGAVTFGDIINIAIAE